MLYSLKIAILPVWTWYVLGKQSFVHLRRMLMKDENAKALLFLQVHPLCNYIPVNCITTFGLVSIVPATPTSSVCGVYDEVDGALQIIENTWNEMVCTLAPCQHAVLVVYRTCYCYLNPLPTSDICTIRFPWEIGSV